MLKFIKETKGINNFGRWNSSSSFVKKVYNIQALQISNVGTENIIDWLFSDLEIKNAVMEELCSSDLSYYRAHPGRAGSEASNKFRGNIPSYMFYFFKSASWISINGSYKNPESVLMDDAKGESWFQNLSQKYSQANIETLLKKLGVKTDLINSKAEDFYKEILRQSQNQDKIAAAKLYRKIADPANNTFLENIANYVGDEYQKFQNQGMVLAANREGKEEFHKATDTYFTSSAVLNFSNKYIMKTPSRQGKADLFKKIFCVKEFKEEKVEVQNFIEHEKGPTFKSDFRDFIPYFLLLRGTTYENNATSEKTINDLKNLSIVLAKKINLKVFIDNNGNQEEKVITALKPYSVIKQSAGQWFIYTGDEDYNKIRIGEALKTIFYVILNSPAAEQLEYCESYFPNGTDYCKRKLDEKGYDIHEIDHIIQKLKNSTNYEEKFKTAFPNISFDEETINLIKQIDFNLLGKNSERFIKLAKKIGKDISEISEALGIKLTIVRYNKDRLKGYIEVHETLLYHYFIETLKNASIDEKESLESLITGVKEWASDLSIEEIPELNSIHFDEKYVLKKHLETYHLDYDDLQNVPDIKTKYAANKSKLFKICGINVNDTSFEDSLLYFDINWEDPSDSMAQALKEKLQATHNASETPATKEIKILENVKFKDDEIPASSYTYKPSAGKGSGAYPGGNGKGDEPNQHNGDIAEYTVYDLILKHSDPKITEIIEGIIGKYPTDVDHVKWLSGAAHRIKKFKANDSKGYDIEVYGNNGECLHIEVKSSTGQECSFFMSENERQAAEKYQEYYAVIFVGGVGSKDPSIRFIGNPFTMQYSKEGDNDGFLFTPLKYHVDYKVHNSEN